MRVNSSSQHIADSPESGALQGERRIGIIYMEESGRGLTHPFFSLILDAFKKEAESRGCEITFLNTGIPGSGMNWSDYCRLSGIDGVCVVCGNFDSQDMKDLASSGLPCVTIDHMYKRVCAVLSDNETGVRELVEYAISKGHRRIAFIHGHNNSIVTRARISQFRNTMSVHSLPVPPEYIQDGKYDDIKLTRKLVTNLLTLPERPTFILLPDDISYLGAQDAARECSLSIPGDISFAGYDGSPLTQALTPKLTTIRQDTDQIGRLAATRIIDLIDHPSTATRMPAILPVRFMEGGTVGTV